MAEPPTSELLAETVPLTPVVALHHVTAPAFVAAPLRQDRLLTRKLPLLRTVMPSLPTASFAVEPVRVLMTASVAPSSRYTAPTLAAPAGML